jgi:hypothetical protein
MQPLSLSKGRGFRRELSYFMKSLIFKLFLTAIGGCFIMLFALPWSYFNLELPFSGSEYKLGLDLSG